MGVDNADEQTELQISSYSGDQYDTFDSFENSETVGSIEELPQGYYEIMVAHETFQSFALTIIIGFLVAICLIKGINN